MHQNAGFNTIYCTECCTENLGEDDFPAAHRERYQAKRDFDAARRKRDGIVNDLQTNSGKIAA